LILIVDDGDDDSGGLLLYLDAPGDQSRY